MKNVKYFPEVYIFDHFENIFLKFQYDIAKGYNTQNYFLTMVKNVRMKQAKDNNIEH